MRANTSAIPPLLLLLDSPPAHRAPASQHSAVRPLRGSLGMHAAPLGPPGPSSPLRGLPGKPPKWGWLPASRRHACGACGLCDAATLLCACGVPRGVVGSRVASGARGACLDGRPRGLVFVRARVPCASMLASVALFALRASSPWGCPLVELHLAPEGTLSPSTRLGRPLR